MKKLLFLILLVPLVSFSQGFISESKESIKNIGKYSKKDFGFGFIDDIPSSKSLVKYVPPIGNQKQTGSCTAWSTTYYNLSIIYNRMFGITKYNAKLAHSFDPWYTYSMLNKIENNSTNCSLGLRVSDAMSFLKNYGPKKLFFPPFDLSCNASLSNHNFGVVKRYSDPFKILKYEVEYAKNFKPYFNPLSDRVINLIKVEIGKYAFPVIATFINYGKTLGNVGSNGYWYPSYQNESSGHAMTIVGYDDYKNGGSFLLVNSWGKDWGDNGYAWIKYSDFKRFCDAVVFTWIHKDIDTEYPQMNFKDYVRKKFKSNKNKIYEGERNSKNITGYGIVSNLDNETYNIGYFKKGIWDGTFKVFDNEGYWQVEYDNGKFVEELKLGFVEDKKNMEKVEEINNYIKIMFPDIRFKEGGKDNTSSKFETIQ